MSINMNGNMNDMNYRYKMPKVITKISGRGNGIYTIFTNIEDVCKSINHPIEVILSYIATITGSNCIFERNTITGTHNGEYVTELLLEYIKYLIMCPKCNIPETIPVLNGKKKNMYITLNCSACKNETMVESINKRINKGTDIIIKYLKSGHVWPVSKGTMVKQTNSVNNDLTIDINETKIENKEMIFTQPFSFDFDSI